MNRFIPKKNFLIFSISVFLISILIYVVTYFIVQTEIANVKSAHKDVESVLYKKERVKALEVLVSNNEENISKLREFFIKKGDEVKFIEYIENIAKDTSVDFEISTIDFEPNKEYQTIENATVKINIRGSWNSVMSFVDKLEKSYFGVLIKEININSNSEGSWFGQLIFNIYREL